jgi:hypothetical protein
MTVQPVASRYTDWATQPTINHGVKFKHKLQHDGTWSDVARPARPYVIAQ